ncbi:MAG: TonB-dependent receptor [Phycisphaerales bacterium]|nr:TonB-dependent receptor [Hyphomonadaceae bacterium]
MAIAAFALCASVAHAQEADEIVVTADKRGEARAQDLPITLNAFGAEQLRALNLEDLQSLSYAIPNVQFEDVGTARGVANYSIRGVGVNSSIASVDPAVGLFIDGMYVGVNAGALTDLFDVEAVEVLRGPQGALYGRNVTGGAVLVRTRAPADVFEAQGRAAVETGANFITEAAISGPLAEGVLSARLALYRAEDDGWLENDFDGSSFGRNETSIYRAALRFTPSASFEALLRVEQGAVDGDGPAGQNHALHARDSFNFAIDNRGYAATDWEQAILEMNWRVAFGDGVVTSISAWRSVEVPWAADIDSTPNFVFHTRVLNAHEQRSQELRYAGGFGAFDVTAGLYYLDQDLLYIDERNFSPTFRRVGGGQGEFTSWAAFASADWRLRETLTLSFGARYTREEKESRISRVRRAIDDLDGPGVLVPGEGVAGGDIDARTLAFSDAPFLQDGDDLSPRVGLQWRPSAETNIYASWSRAFRGGGANFRTASLGLAPRAYDPEEQSTFEIGWKQDLAQGRARLNAALFHNTIENMQRETNQADSISGVQQIVLNAGDATIWGGEIEARFDVTDALTIAAHAGYVEGEYDTITEDLNGDLLINAADYALEIPRLAPWTYGASLNYAAPFAGGELSARISYNHRDAAFYNDNNLGRLAEADMIGANLSFAPADGRWRVSLYGENLLDEATWGGDTVLPSTAAFGFTPGGERPTFSPLNKGRVLGIELRAMY